MASTLGASQTAETQGSRVNILFMLVDNLGYAELGVYGSGDTGCAYAAHR